MQETWDIKIESVNENLKKNVCGIVKKCNHYFENIVKLYYLNDNYFIKVTGDIKFANIVIM